MSQPQNAGYQLPSPERLAEITSTIETALKQCSVDVIKHLPAMEQAIKLAQGMKTLREALKPEINEALFVPLQNTTLGFLTDKEEGYAGKIVRDCVIEAMIRGFQVVGNEFNIISGRAYFTQRGFERRVREFPGISNLLHHPMIYVMAPDNKTALVPYKITYKLEGVERTFEKKEEERLQVRVNAGMGPDGVIGKARRKALAALFEELNGLQNSSLAMPEGDVGDVVTTAEPVRGTSQQQSLDDLAAKQRGGKKDDHPEPGSRG